jgi:hypothetical protein
MRRPSFFASATTHRSTTSPRRSAPGRGAASGSVFFGGTVFVGGTLRGAALIALALAGGCDPDCADPGRIDGIWSVRGNATNDAAELKITQESSQDITINEPELVYGVFANGPSSWDVKYVPANGKYTIIIAEQTFKATHEPDADNCNAFALRFSGDFAADDGAEHQFDWQGNLTWSGDEMGGTFAYDDTWTLDGAAGTITIPKGELIAQRGSDTGGAQ